MDVTAISTEIAIILAIASLASLVIRKFLLYLKTPPQASFWLKTLGESLYNPSLWLIWGYTFFLILTLLIKDSEFKNLRALFLSVGFFWLILIWKSQVTEYFLKCAHTESERTLVSILSRLTHIVICSVATLIVLDLLNIPIAGLLAFGGVGGIAISLAGGDVIKNFFGGLMIFINHHFQVGDWIRSPNKDFEGIVEEIGWYMTKIRTLDRKPMFIPNSLMTDAIIENPSRMYNRKFEKNFGLRYEDFSKIPQVLDEIRAMLEKIAIVDQEQSKLVNLTHFGESSVDITVYCFTKGISTEEWRKDQEELLMNIYDIIKKHQADLAFPSQVIYLEKQS